MGDPTAQRGDSLEVPIYQILDSYRKNPHYEKFDSSKICEKIKYFVDNNLRILFVFPGFHGKIKNANHVLGSSVDMGEWIALQNIAGLLEKISAIYPPGVSLYIVHEGHFHIGKSPVISSEVQLDEYLYDFRQLLSPYKDIESYSIFDLMHSGSNLEECLNEFHAKYVPTDEDIATLIRSREHYLKLYTAYKKVNAIQLETETGFQDLPKKEKCNRAKRAAFNQMQVTLGFGRLIEAFFKDRVYIRLSSLYKDPTFLDHVSINYLPNRHHFSTPTFNCLVQYEDGSYDYMRRSDAVEKNFTLTEYNGLKYFKEEYCD